MQTCHCCGARLRYAVGLSWCARCESIYDGKPPHQGMRYEDDRLAYEDGVRWRITHPTRSITRCEAA